MVDTHFVPLIVALNRVVLYEKYCCRIFRAKGLQCSPYRRPSWCMSNNRGIFCANLGFNQGYNPRQRSKIPSSKKHHIIQIQFGCTNSNANSLQDRSVLLLKTHTNEKV